MLQNRNIQDTINGFQLDDYLEIWIDAFMMDRKAQNMAKGTIHYYQYRLKEFVEYCGTQEVKRITQIDPNLLRQYFLTLQQNGHNPGGVHMYYRVIKAFLRWWENEVEPQNWKNPIKKVKAPKNPVVPLNPANIEDVRAMIDVCPKDNFYGTRDRAIMLVLLDTGLRANELCSINVEDLNLITGEIHVKVGKGRKSRYAFIGSKARKAVRLYLRYHPGNVEPLWLNRERQRLEYWSLDGIMRRRAKEANVSHPSLHSFRRWFALTCLRAGMDAFSLQELMGHSDLQVLKRYLKQTSPDLMIAHKRACPVDSNV
ncbi:MAG: tyrosine-type recombinase/integrase [Anaerolineaceae bacterium]